MTDVLGVAVTERAVLARVNRPGVRNAWDREVGAALAGLLEADGLARREAELSGRLEDHPYPTVAVVDGPALGGGCELALGGDFRVAGRFRSRRMPGMRPGVPAGAAIVSGEASSRRSRACRAVAGKVGR